MSEQERIMNVALLLWGGCFCLTAAFCLSMGKDHNREKRNWMLWMDNGIGIWKLCRHTVMVCNDNVHTLLLRISDSIIPRYPIIHCNNE